PLTAPCSMVPAGNCGSGGGFCPCPTDTGPVATEGSVGIMGGVPAITMPYALILNHKLNGKRRRIGRRSGTGRADNQRLLVANGVLHFRVAADDACARRREFEEGGASFINRRI